MDLQLAGRTFILTGASRGLGLATAETLVAEGANVMIVARQQDTVDAAVSRLGERAAGIAADIADERTAEVATEIALSRFGRLDGALISAGSPTPGTPMTATDAEWTTAFQTVFLGGLRVARAAVTNATPAEPSGTGCSIVFVLSSSAKSPISGLVLSNGLRPGLAMMVKDLADEVGPAGIRVNGLLPGRIATDNVLTQDTRRGDPEQVRSRNEQSIPLRRYGQPAEFGRLAAFLLSPAASYVTGAVISVDGGALRGL